MALTIQIPAAVESRLRDQAAAAGKAVEDLAASLLIEMTSLPSTSGDLFDNDCHAECESDTSPVPSLEEVRDGLASIPGSMTQDFIDERDER